ncbi:serine/threonine-protein kinase-like protein ACR4 isoform X3 [Arachis hypogaea]|uniref:serine/threonine-protein kinase-like protein ACR4 isoform X3 n=1 Tax=Arachis hypogaea TaxID=3818 RepID=UPI0007AFE15E|nr:serine/threonine-protein kinase-like protein ACR4 isoform X3 [Arachis hypogaea]
MGFSVRDLLIYGLNMQLWLFFHVMVLSYLWSQVTSLGSMSSIAISYGEQGSVFCGLKLDGSHTVTCYGSNTAIIYETPSHFSFIGLTAGDGFICGLLMDSNQPYCWGSSGYIEMGVPQPMIKEAEYIDISAGDHHVCGLRKPLTGRFRNTSFVDCWGYNMTRSYVFDGMFQSISAGSGFNCGLFSQNRSVFCWGDETSSRVITLIPDDKRFQRISAGGYHVCGILEGVKNSRAVCWGRSLDIEEEISVSVKQHAGSYGQGNVDLAPSDPMLSVVGGKFHACGIKSYDREVICWGFIIKPSTPPPSGTKVFEIAGGDYFSCGVLAERSLMPVCWGVGFPKTLPLAVSPGMCKSNPCPPGFYEIDLQKGLCKSTDSRICIHCSSGDCPSEMYQKSSCGRSKVKKLNGGSNSKNRTNLEEFKIRRAQMFTYEELETATNGFKEESIVGKGSFSCVFKGVLKDGTVVAVKRAIVSTNMQKNSKEFHTELDLLSRLNHAHLLNLLGYCEEGNERLLVYEFMAHGSLHQHLHGPNKVLKEQLDWIRRVTIAVQAARGIEYLHGYACPPVIHRDIKSSNILIDEEHNARVADFGLSLLGPADSGSPLAELPAGTLGYLDPEYYRLHYLTTKSDVYSFGVLLLEILSGRKAIDMQYEEGNIVEWAVPLIKSGDIAAILDPVLKPPSDLEALKRIANVACKCVRMRGKERPSMDKVTTALERGLAMLMGSPCIEQPILPTEVVLGSNRLHKKSSQRSSNRSASETTEVAETEDQRIEFRAPSWITFPSVTSSQRRKSSVSDADVEGGKNNNNNISNNAEVNKNLGNVVGVGGDGLKSLEEEIGPASPRERLFLQHNF